MLATASTAGSTACFPSYYVVLLAAVWGPCFLLSWELFDLLLDRGGLHAWLLHWRRPRIIFLIAVLVFIDLLAVIGLMLGRFQVPFPGLRVLCVEWAVEGVVSGFGLSWWDRARRKKIAERESRARDDEGRP